MWMIKLTNVQQVGNSQHQVNPHENNVIIRLSYIHLQHCIPEKQTIALFPKQEYISYESFSLLLNYFFECLLKHRKHYISHRGNGNQIVDRMSPEHLRIGRNIISHLEGLFSKLQLFRHSHNFCLSLYPSILVPFFAIKKKS